MLAGDDYFDAFDVFAAALAVPLTNSILEWWFGTSIGLEVSLLERVAIAAIVLTMLAKWIDEPVRQFWTKRAWLHHSVWTSSIVVIALGWLGSRSDPALYALLPAMAFVFAFMMMTPRLFHKFFLRQLHQ